MTRAARQGVSQKSQEAENGDSRGSTSILAPISTVDSHVVAEKRCWHVWFAARPAIPLQLRGRRKNGKPKPQPPRLPLNVNDRTRVHWRVVGQLTAYWRSEAKRLARQFDIPPCARIRVSAEVHRMRTVRVDERGEEERLKALIDGLVDAKVIPDDTRDYLEHGRVESVFGTAEGLLLIVEAL